MTQRQTHEVQLSSKSSFPWGDVVDIPKFNPALGTLERVALQVEGRIHHTYRVENITTGASGAAGNVHWDVDPVAAQSGVYTVPLEDAAVWTLNPTLGVICSEDPIAETRVDAGVQDGFVGPYDGVLDYSGAGGLTVNNVHWPSVGVAKTPSVYTSDCMMGEFTLVSGQSGSMAFDVDGTNDTNFFPEDPGFVFAHDDTITHESLKVTVVYFYN
jgi:hypothetical protein